MKLYFVPSTLQCVRVPKLLHCQIERSSWNLKQESSTLHRVQPISFSCRSGFVYSLLLGPHNAICFLTIALDIQTTCFVSSGGYGSPCLLWEVPPELWKLHTHTALCTLPLLLQDLNFTELPVSYQGLISILESHTQGQGRLFGPSFPGLAHIQFSPS